MTNPYELITNHPKVAGSGRRIAKVYFTVVIRDIITECYKTFDTVLLTFNKMYLRFINSVNNVSTLHEKMSFDLCIDKCKHYE